MATEATVTWVGADGSVWNLLDPSSPVQLPGGISGLHLPTFDQQWATSARVPGRRRTGVVTNARDVQLRVHVGDLSSPARVGPYWRAIDAAWWDSMREDAPGTLTVETAQGARSLQLWLSDGNDPSYATDPALVGSCLYDVVLSAEDAYWSGPELEWVFDYATDGVEDFFGGAGGGGYGPPFVISGGSQFETAQIYNPGDQDAYPRYALTAPFGSARIGVGNAVVTLPFALVGGSINIDTDPRRLSITSDDGTNLWPLLGDGPDPLFAAVPRRSTVPLTIQMDAAGSGAGVVVNLTPPYRRALS